MGENVGGAITSAVLRQKGKKSHKLFPLALKAYTFTRLDQTKLSASCDNEQVFISPGGLSRDGCDEKFGTGALQFCLAVIRVERELA